MIYFSRVCPGMPLMMSGSPGSLGAGVSGSVVFSTRGARFNVAATVVIDTSGKESVCQCRGHEMQVRSLGREDPLE